MEREGDERNGRQRPGFRSAANAWQRLDAVGRQHDSDARRTGLRCREGWSILRLQLPVWVCEDGAADSLKWPGSSVPVGSAGLEQVFQRLALSGRCRPAAACRVRTPEHRSACQVPALADAALRVGERPRPLGQRRDLRADRCSGLVATNGLAACRSRNADSRHDDARPTSSVLGQARGDRFLFFFLCWDALRRTVVRLASTSMALFSSAM